MEGLTKYSWGLSVSPLWPAGETGRPTVGHCPGHLQAGGRFPVPGSGGGDRGPVCSSPMASSSLGSGFIFIHLILSVGSVKRVNL